MLTEEGSVGFGTGGTVGFGALVLDVVGRLVGSPCGPLEEAEVVSESVY